MLSIRVAPVLAIALAVAAPLAAQAPAGPDARMQAFLKATRDYALTSSLAEFFPWRGDVVWVSTTHGRAGTRVGRWRFPAARLVDAAENSGPLCETFDYGGDLIAAGTLMFRILEEDGGWRRVSAVRFVPPGAAADDPTFVEWRLEEGRWVISAFGDERYRFQRVLGGLGGRPAEMARDAIRADPLTLPLPPDASYAAGQPWYEENEPIIIEDQRLVKYGFPRRLEAGTVRRIGSVDGVGVYVELREGFHPEVVYLPVSPDGLFQSYQDNLGTGCPDRDDNWP